MLYMAATIVSDDDDKIVIRVSIPKHRCMLKCEEEIQKQLNEAGKSATKSCLEDFDTDGSPIIMGNQKFTAKKVKVAKQYETPYGPVTVDRYCYQNPQGGAVHVPLDHAARIFGSATPRFANIASYKYANNDAKTVVHDLQISMERSISLNFVRNVSQLVAEGISEKEGTWELTTSEPSPHDVANVAIGLDGASVFFADEGWRQAMAGTIAFFDAAGERLHTRYIGAAPEHGKATFFERMDAEIHRVKQKYRRARYIGISDGASDFLPWLKTHTTTQVLDFWHLCEYINEVAKVIFDNQSESETWVEDRCHDLKHDHGASQELLNELKANREQNQLAEAAVEPLERAITYLENNLGRTNYASYRKSHIPIGSGITEAACKTLIKRRLCGSGMQWKYEGCDAVICLRSLSLTDGAWEEFWAKIRKFGI